MGEAIGQHLRRDRTPLIEALSDRLPFVKPCKAIPNPNSKAIQIRDGYFIDTLGRVMILHGINIGGGSKVPYNPPQPTHIRTGFFEAASSVSFVNRPFPLSEASAHFKRLYNWGYRFVRLVVTWEAIEHEGPGIYDSDYLDYIEQLVRLAGEHDINLFIDPHQDVWSRFTGGDGAPYWTMELAGFNPINFTETGAAIVHNMHGDPFPTMIWGTNNSKLAASTMFTLFFGGRTFAPNLMVDGLSIQDYLQQHYINAIKQLALRLTGYGNVIGFDTMNEPSAGYIGQTDLNKLNILRMGAMPTAFQGMVAGGGNSVRVKKYSMSSLGPFFSGHAIINREMVSAWQNQASDIWFSQGVWGYNENGKPHLIKPNFFSEVNGRCVDFAADFYKPFIQKFVHELSAVDSSWLFFTEPALFSNLPKFDSSEALSMVNATHWYDAITLVTKKYSPYLAVDAEKGVPVFGAKRIRGSFHKQLGRIKQETSRSMGNVPTLIGEFGIPFDMQKGKAYKSGDYTLQVKALDRTFRALESNMLSYTLWNYTSHNTHERGDGWNGEDLSIFSLSEQADSTDLNSGGRALNAAIRPYPYRVAGLPVEYTFDYKTKVFSLTYIPNNEVETPTEVFVPDFHYASGFKVRVSGGSLSFDRMNSLLLHTAADSTMQTIIIHP